MNIFVDTNVVVDFYQRREPFFFPAATIFDLAQSRQPAFDHKSYGAVGVPG